MKTAQTIEEQEERKAARDNGEGRASLSQNSGPVSGRRGRIENLKPWKPGQSGNPGGKPKVDLAAQIARAIFEHDAPAIFAAYAKMLRKGSPYAFSVLSDRAYGKLKEQHQLEIGPYRDVSEADIKARIAQLEKELGVLPAAAVIESEDDTKPN